MSNNYPTIKPSLNLQFSNTGALPPDVTFTRASQSGGYYDGVTVSKAEENLFTFSEQFDNAIWTKNDASVTANATTAPNGTATADKLIEAATTAIHTARQTLTTTAATHIYSVYLKAAERTFALLRYGNTDGITVDLTTGAASLDVGSVSSITSTDAGSGWWRVSFAVTTSAAAGSFRIYVSTDGVGANASYAGDGTSGIFVWGAQLEQRSTVTAYNVTTTQPITNYIPRMLFAAANVPVFDHNPVTGEALGLSVWEARTNLLLRSQEFDNASWTKTESTISANQIIAPDGTLTADKIIETTANSVHTAQQTFSATSGTTYTVSAYVKKAERGFALIALITAFPTTSIQINLTTGAVTTGTGTPLNAFSVNVGNGWYRVGFSLAATSTTTASANYYVSSDGTWAGRVYVGSATSGIYIWGAQLEAGAFVTPYIPTVGSTVTRSADAAVMTGANFSRWFNAGEGSFVVDASSVNGAGFRTSFTATEATATNFIDVAVATTAGGQGRYLVYYANAAQVDTGNLTLPAFTANTYYKNAVSYKVNDFAISRDGAAVVTDTAGNLPIGIDRLIIGSRASADRLNGYIKSLQYYPTRLTNANLVAVTQ